MSTLKPVIHRVLPQTVAVIAPRPDDIKALQAQAEKTGQKQIIIPPNGAGVIIDKAGFIITNNHVVDGALEDSLAVLDTQGVTHKATLVGRSPTADIAVLKIEPYDGMAVATYGDSDALETGDSVFAIGNPMSMDASVSVGIISHPARFLRPWQAHFKRVTALPVAQFDAACNPGNSGGGLFNDKGELVGINTFILTAQVTTAPQPNFPLQLHGSAMGHIGLNMALKSNGVKNVVELIRRGDGQATNPHPLFRINQGTPVENRIFQQMPPAMLDVVSAQGKKLGFMRGDTLQTIAGEKVQNAFHAEALLVKYAAQTVDITITRKKQGSEVTLKGINLPSLTVITSLAEEAVAARVAELGYLAEVSYKSRTKKPKQ